MARARRRAHHLGQFKAVHARHLDVEDGQREFVLEQQCERGVTGTGLVNHALVVAQQRLKRLQVLGQVIDDQDFA